MRRRAIATVALLALSCQATAPPPPPTPPVVEAPPPPVAPRPDPPPPDALVVVTAALPGLEPVAAADAPWVPVTALRAVLRASGELPLPGAPERRDDHTTWAMLLQQGAPATAAAAICAAVTADAHLACAGDRVEHAGRIRARVVVGWREAPAAAPAALSRAQPLRALSRVARGVCLVSAQETERTLDLTVRADDEAALGETLALLVVSPGLRELITVRVEPQGGGLQATLSWPLARATTRDMGDDAWPARCGGALDLGAGLPAGTLPVARAYVPGARASGAVMTLGRSAWVVTAGDRLGRAAVTAVDAGGVTLQRPGVARPVRLPWRP